MFDKQKTHFSPKMSKQRLQLLVAQGKIKWYKPAGTNAPGGQN
jgi:hypothetical protein